MSRRVNLTFLFIVADALMTFLSLGFFSPSFEFRFDLVFQCVFFVDGYNFTTNPFDFVVLFLLRMLALSLAGIIFVAFNEEAVKLLDLPILGLNIFSISYSIVKLLAFSEVPAQLYYWGLWFLLTWTVFASLLFSVLWHFLLANTSFEYQRFFNQDEQTGSITESSTEHNGNATENTENELSESKLSTLQHIIVLLLYCGKQWKWYSAGFFFLILYSAVRIFIPLYTGTVISNIVHGKDYSALLHSVLIMAALTMASSVFGGFRGGCFDYANALISRQVRFDLFRSLVHQEIAFFDNTKTGEMVSRLTSDCGTISDTISVNLNVFLRNGVMLLGSLVFMFLLSWRLSLVTFVAIPPIAYVTKVYGVFFDRLSERLQTSIANANQTAEEVLSTMRTVRSFACERKESKRFENMLHDTLSIGRKRAIGYVGNNLVNEFSNNAVLVAVLAYGGHLVLSGRMQSDAFISFLMYQMQLGENLYNIGYVVTGLMQSVGASRKVFAYINRKPRIANDGDARPTVHGTLELKDVSFTYPSRPKNPVLQNLSLLLNAGETVALVGPSGGGKSSIVSLIEHFYEPDKGTIVLDGVPVSEYDHLHYHQNVALVAQEPVLYGGTVRQNIAYGCEWATEDNIINAAKLANVHDFVMDLEKGYDTLCGEKGVQMSGGQKQRIAIARALIRNPRVLILDEATSALDAESENVVQEAITRCARERSVLIIAHRLSTIEKADRIAVINKGTVVQSGTHSQLMADQAGLYHNMVSRQLTYGLALN